MCERKNCKKVIEKTTAVTIFFILLIRISVKEKRFSFHGKLFVPYAAIKSLDANAKNIKITLKSFRALISPENVSCWGGKKEKFPHFIN